MVFPDNSPQFESQQHPQLSQQSLEDEDFDTLIAQYSQALFNLQNELDSQS